jgi:hypothetical protein
MTSEVESSHLEEQRLALDYVKHVTTVSASIIVVGATFLDKLQAQPSGTWLVSVTFVALLATVVSLVLAAVGVVNSARSGGLTTPGVVTFTTSATAVGLVAFLVGMAALSCFVLVNV